jgi:transposase
VAKRTKPYREFSDAFKRRAVEQMETADNIRQLARDLGVSWRQLYQWQAKLKGKPKQRPRGAPQPRAAVSAAEQELQEEIRHLREALGKRTLEVDFFKGALQRIEARRQNSAAAGGRPCTERSGN